MAVVAHYNLFAIPSKHVMLPWQRMGLQYTASGYGRKIPTTIMVQLPGSPRSRRVYCCIFSNSGTCYVTRGKDWVTIDGSQSDVGK